MIQVVNQFLESKKGTPDGGEDRLVITPDFVAVVDGATSKDGKTIDDKTGGWLAAEIIADTIKKLPRAIDAFAAVTKLTVAVREQLLVPHMPHVLEPNYCGDIPNASVIIYSEDKGEIWRVGDGHYKADGRISTGKRKIDEANATLRAGFLQALLDRRMVTVEGVQEKDPGREIITASLMAQSVLMNNPHSPLGFGAIDGRLVPEKFIQRHRPLAAQIMLASDGLLVPAGRAAHGMTVQDMLAQQQAYYKNDPLMIRQHPATKGVAKGQKWHDDIAVVEFTI